MYGHENWASLLSALPTMPAADDQIWDYVERVRQQSREPTAAGGISVIFG